MRTLIALLLLVTTAHAADVTVKIEGPTEADSGFALVGSADHDAVLRWRIDGPDKAVPPLELLDSQGRPVLVFMSPVAGRYKVTLTGQVAVDGLDPWADATHVVVVGKVPPKPVPVPDIDDDDTPTPVPPKPDVDPILPGNGFRAMILYESGDRLPAGQSAILTSARLRDYLKSKGGEDCYRIWDDDLTDANLANQPQEWRTGFANVKKAAESVPWLVATNGSKQVSVALPHDVDTTIQVLQGIE